MWPKSQAAPDWSGEFTVDVNLGLCLVNNPLQCLLNFSMGLGDEGNGSRCFPDFNGGMPQDFFFAFLLDTVSKFSHFPIFSY